MSKPKPGNSDATNVRLGRNSNSIRDQVLVLESLTRFVLAPHRSEQAKCADESRGSLREPNGLLTHLSYDERLVLNLKTGSRSEPRPWSDRW